MLKKVDNFRGVFRSTQEREQLCRKMQKEGWVVKKQEDTVGFFLRLEASLHMERHVEIDAGKELRVISVAVCRDELDACRSKERRQVFRRCFGRLAKIVADEEAGGWRGLQKPYKKYYAKDNQICFSINQILVRCEK